MGLSMLNCAAKVQKLSIKMTQDKTCLWEKAPLLILGVLVEKKNQEEIMYEDIYTEELARRTPEAERSHDL